jgi:hypothetical protein
VDYVATRDAGKPAAARGIYRVLDDGGMDLPGPRKADPAVHLRRILVYSPANAAGQAKARALKLAKAAGELDKLVRTAGTRFHPTPTPSLPGSRRSPPNAASGCTCAPRSPEASSASRYCPGTSTRPRSTPEAAADGWDALLTNLAPGPAGQEEVFRRHKGQHVVERRYGEFKGPLAVAPLFLKTNRRMTARVPAQPSRAADS